MEQEIIESMEIFFREAREYTYNNQIKPKVAIVHDEIDYLLDVRNGKG